MLIVRCWIYYFSPIGKVGIHSRAVGMMGLQRPSLKRWPKLGEYLTTLRLAPSPCSSIQLLLRNGMCTQIHPIDARRNDRFGITAKSNCTLGPIKQFGERFRHRDRPSS